MEVEAVDEGKIAQNPDPRRIAGHQGQRADRHSGGRRRRENDCRCRDGALWPKNPAARRFRNAADRLRQRLLRKRPSEFGARPQEHVCIAARVIASPLAKRMAEQTGVDLQTLRGTGPEWAHRQGRCRERQSIGGSCAGARAFTRLPAQGIDARDYADKLGMAYEPAQQQRAQGHRQAPDGIQTDGAAFLSVDRLRNR